MPRFSEKSTHRKAKRICLLFIVEMFVICAQHISLHMDGWMCEIGWFGAWPKTIVWAWVFVCCEAWKSFLAHRIERAIKSELYLFSVCNSFECFSHSLQNLDVYWRHSRDFQTNKISSISSKLVLFRFVFLFYFFFHFILYRVVHFHSTSPSQTFTPTYSCAVFYALVVTISSVSLCPYIAFKARIHLIFCSYLFRVRLELRTWCSSLFIYI